MRTKKINVKDYGFGIALSPGKPNIQVAKVSRAICLKAHVPWDKQGVWIGMQLTKGRARTLGMALIQMADELEKDNG